MKKLQIQITIFKERGFWKYIHFLLLRIAKFLKIGFYFAEIPKKNVDILYVVHKKDLINLKKSIDSLKFIKNITINNIFIISNEILLLNDLINDPRAIFIKDDKVLGFNFDHYQYPVNGNGLSNRSGWLFQQLLKLGWSTHSKSENYITIDADTYFINPISFFDQKDRFIFFGTEEWWPPYFEAFKILFNKRPPLIWSRVAHMMIFNRYYVQQMLQELESMHGVAWHAAIAKTRVINSHSCFSEYETYANWMSINYPEKCSVRPSYNQTASSKENSMPAKNMISISTHSYLR
jgi:hypothetical protein